MCVKARYINVNKGLSYEQIAIPCKTCWQCRANRVNDYVGRALAESVMADQAITFTLTYSDSDKLNSKMIRPSDHQKFVRSLRRKGYLVRYLAVGEYGSAKGRAHFHSILFFYGKPYPIAEYKKHISIPEWPHGHVFCDYGTNEKAIRYVVKYILKDITDPEKQGYMTMSKRPPLGSLWFAKKACEHAEMGIFPTRLSYLPPNGSTGKSYPLTGASRRDYLSRLVVEWEKHRPLDLSRLAEHIEKAVGKTEQYKTNREFLADQKLNLNGLENSQIAIAEAESRRPNDKTVARLLLKIEAEYNTNAAQGGVYGF